MSEAATQTNSPQPKVKVYLESRYRKLERGLPQTIFYCPKCKGDRRRARGCGRCEGFGKLTRDSVQELIGRKAVPLFKAKRGKFHGAGREDVDVLMLGRGRPFVYEVVDARRPDLDLATLDTAIRQSCAGRIELDPFRRVTRDRVPHWKEARFDKVYRAVVATEAPFDAGLARGFVGQSFTIAQRTPARVAHRRADLERERHVAVLAVREPASDERALSLTLDLRCSHGCYVKEWISGDEGRTVPSLAALLAVPSTCAQLDVLDILDY